MDPLIGSSLFILLIFIIINAFFSGAEVSLMSQNKSDLRSEAEEGDKKASQILKLLDDSTGLLDTISTITTYLGYYSCAYVGVTISPFLMNQAEKMNFSVSFGVALIFSTFVVYCFMQLFGFLLPKRIAIQNTKQISNFTISSLKLVNILLKPLHGLLSGCMTLILKLFHLKTENLEESVSKEEIKAMVASGSEAGVFNDIEREMIDSIFNFDDKDAKDIMIPRNDVLMMDAEDSIDEHMEEILESRHSRIPVYRENTDHIIGIFRVKDFLIERIKRPNEDMKEVTPFLSEPLFVPDRKNIDELFRQMQKEKERMAILIDEYGGFSGIVTLEDLVEEIMGDIYEEHEIEEPDMVSLQKNVYQLDGQMSLDDLNEELSLNLSSETYDTVSGLILENCGTLPTLDTVVTLDNLRFEVKAMEGRRITEVLLTILEEENNETK